MGSATTTLVRMPLGNAVLFEKLTSGEMNEKIGAFVTLVASARVDMEQVPPMKAWALRKVGAYHALMRKQEKGHVYACGHSERIRMCKVSIRQRTAMVLTSMFDNPKLTASRTALEVVHLSSMVYANLIVSQGRYNAFMVELDW